MIYGGVGIAEYGVYVVVGHVADPNVEVFGRVPGVAAAGGCEFHVVGKLVGGGTPLGGGGGFSNDACGGISLGIGGS